MSDEPLFPPRRVVDKFALFSACNYEPTPPQRIVHEAGPQDAGGHRFRVISAGVRTGKTHSAAWELVAASIAPNDYETEWWCVAPLHSLAARCFDMVCAAYSQHFPEHVVSMKQHDGLLVVRNLAGHEARILRRSTERGLVALTGASVDGMVLDEASAIPDDIWESSLSTRLLDRLGWVLAISSPRGTGGWWARMLRVGLRGDDPDVFGITMPTWSNPRVSRKEILKIKRRMEAWRFDQEYGGKLVAHAGKVFVPEAVEQCATGRPRPPETGAVYVAGLDLAIAHDFTVLMVAKRGEDGLAEVVHVDRFHRLPWAAQVSRIRSTLARYHDAAVRVDSTGLGNPVLAQLREADVPAEGVVLTAQKKTEIVRNLAVLLERGRIEIPMREWMPELHDELAAYEYLDRDGGDLRKMGAPAGGHDDCVIALALCASYFRGGGFTGRSHFVGKPIHDIGTTVLRGSQPAPKVKTPEPDEDGVVWLEDDRPGVHTAGEAIGDDHEVPRPVVTMDDVRRGAWRRLGFGDLGVRL